MQGKRNRFFASKLS